MSTAQTTETGNNAAYKMAIYTFNYQVNTIQALTSNLTTAQTSANGLAMLEVYSNNYLTSSNDNDDTDTDFQNALNTLNSAMPNPGSGTNSAGDTPQEVLFIVTDGADDASISSNLTTISSSYGNSCCGGPPFRLQASINPLDNSGNEVLSSDYCANHQRPRHPHRYSVHRVSPASHQWLVQQPCIPVSGEYWHPVAELRLAGAFL